MLANDSAIISAEPVNTVRDARRQPDVGLHRVDVFNCLAQRLFRFQVGQHRDLPSAAPRRSICDGSERVCESSASVAAVRSALPDRVRTGRVLTASRPVALGAHQADADVDVLALVLEGPDLAGRRSVSDRLAEVFDADPQVGRPDRG